MFSNDFYRKFDISNRLTMHFEHFIKGVNVNDKYEQNLYENDPYGYAIDKNDTRFNSQNLNLNNYGNSNLIGETAVAALHVVKNFGKGTGIVHALRDVSVSFERGKFTAIMGPSGSGKSTLMHVLAGLDSVNSGKVLVDGLDITTMNDKQLTLMRREMVGFIFQSFNLLPMFSAEQNILMPLTLAGKKPDKQWFDTLVNTLGLQNRLKHRPAELSGGQRQRVAIARALISKPSVVFADEPTGNLDSASSSEVLHFLKKSVTELGQTVIMVTHDAVAASYADRAIVFADGQIVEDVQNPTAEGMSKMLMDRSEALPINNGNSQFVQPAQLQ